MSAIQLLGEKRYERAVPLFEEMIASGNDVYTLREIVLALSRIDTPDSRRLIAKLCNHPSPVVKKACKEVTTGKSNGEV